jgi:hypothetical protein
MKNASFAAALSFFFFFFFQGDLFAQKMATWKGGTPGRVSDWNCPSNWKEGRVPNEFSNVLIPNVSSSTFAYPVIEKGDIEVFGLVCEPGATVTLRRSASLRTVDAIEREAECVAFVK